MSEEWLIAQANVLVIAGSDTTATALSTILYFLTRHPQQLDRLQEEVRAAFQNESQMTDSVLQSLPYLCAVIEEGLRMFPPTAFGLPRISPGGGATVDGHFVPSGVSIWTNKSNPPPPRVELSTNASTTGDRVHFFMGDNKTGKVLEKPPYIHSGAIPPTYACSLRR